MEQFLIIKQVHYAWQKYRQIIQGISTMIYPYLNELNEGSELSLYNKLVVSGVITEPSFYRYRNEKIIPKSHTLEKILMYFM